MRVVTKSYEVYKYNELSDDAKRKAMNDYINELIEVMPFEELSHDSNFYKAYKECERMRTPWFIAEYIYEYCKDELEKDLSEYWFLEDGKFFDE